MKLNKALNIIKLGGRVIDDENKLNTLLHAISKPSDPCVIVHGGGDQVTELAERLGVESTFVNGRRMTDKVSLDLVTMVLAGIINKQIVAKLQAMGINAWGLSGVDANLLLSNKRGIQTHDFGFVGDVKAVNRNVLIDLINNGFLPVIAPITHDGNGQLLNTNADTVAYEIAKALAHQYQVNLYYCMDLAGVYEDIANPHSLIETLDLNVYQHLKAKGKIQQGMLVKLENCFDALASNVYQVVISNADNIARSLQGEKAKVTTIQLEEVKNVSEKCNHFINTPSVYDCHPS
ncbi:acetylglutamate kinase [Cysteiniphilum sp. JM-1]|uniref:acetylglutamate kinase n=1 Tax=Cysteiniphilum sp. JM-1 TaxID=2610891 RepID=UPI00168CBCD7|nr:acetylglutamate kinase [Cysteiniphilum sp. JM-1]